MQQSLDGTNIIFSERLRGIYQSVFMIQKILIVHQETSLPVFEKEVEQTINFNSAMITGVLQAIASVGQEMIGRPTDFKKLEYNGFVVSGSYYDGFTIYIFSETELVKEIEKGMKNIVKWFSTTYGSKHEFWDGNMDLFNENRSIIESKISEEMFLWLLYPFQISKDLQLKTEELSLLGKTIYECLQKEIKCTSARLMNEFRLFSEEKVLSELFKMVKQGFIITSFKD